MGLVLAPTRELATQINATIEPMAKAMGLNTTVIYGGISQARQEKALRAGVDIVIACPGRLEDLIRQRILTLEAVEVTVLDEADHMADLGFLPVVKKLMDMTPSQGQRLLFSATLDNGVDKIVQRYLSNPLTHSVDDPQAAVTTMEHHVLVVNDQTVKKQLIVELASGAGRRVLFMRTKHHARKLAKTLTDAGIPAVDLHGNLSQNARDRNLAEFSSGDVRVLVATDVAARGVHVDDVELVIHVDPPTEHKAYLHRSGRTARAGSDGTVVTLTLPEQQTDVKKLMKAAGVEVNFERVTARLADRCRTGGRHRRQGRPPDPCGSPRGESSAAGWRHLHRCQRRAQARTPPGITHCRRPGRPRWPRAGFRRGSAHGSAPRRTPCGCLRGPHRSPCASTA
jgi:superfamily II DNA/RNA helicase